MSLIRITEVRMTMKILNVNKYFFNKAGAETYYFELNKMLEERGHQVIHFSMQDDRNYASPYEKFFVKNIDYEKQTHLFQKIRNGLKIIYSFEAKRKLERLLEEEKPDIIHLQNFHHQLSPSILRASHRYKIPVVYTAHDLKLVCANYKMLVDGRICELCKEGNYICCFRKKCVKSSRVGSLVNTIEMELARKMKVIDEIDMIITPSMFYKNKMQEWGIPYNKLVYIPNFINVEEYSIVSEHKDYFVFFGRISEEKGIFTLLDAMLKVPKGTLYILGTGPLKDEVSRKIQMNRFLKAHVYMLGFKSGEELKDILANAMFNVLPSEWYENGPYSVLEMMCLGKPTIAADIGGLPDMVHDMQNGLLFESGDSNDLAEKINLLLENKKLRECLGHQCRLDAEETHSQKVYYQKLIQIYIDMIQQKGMQSDHLDGSIKYE